MVNFQGEGQLKNLPGWPTKYRAVTDRSLVSVKKTKVERMMKVKVSWWCLSLSAVSRELCILDKARPGR